MINKRALSTIIESVLVIAIAVLSITILASLILPTLDLSPQTACTDLKLNAPIEIKDVCYDVQTGDLQVIVQRSLNSPYLNSLEFSISNAQSANSKSFACSNTCGTCQILNSGESRKYFFNVAKQGLSFVSISADNCALTSTSLENIKNC